MKRAVTNFRHTPRPEALSATRLARLGHVTRAVVVLSVVVLSVVLVGGVMVPPAVADVSGGASGGVRVPVLGKMFDPTFRLGKAGDTLVRGTPALVRGHLHDYVDLVETAFEFSLRAEDEQALRDAIENEFAQSGEFNRKKLLLPIQPMQSIRELALKGKLKEARAKIAAFKRSIEDRITHAPKLPASIVLRNILAYRTEQAWRGKRPLLARAHADNYLTIAWFLAGLARNETETLTSGERAALFTTMRTTYERLTAEQRELMANASSRLARVKAAWDEATKGQRHTMRCKAFDLVAGFLPADAQMTSKGCDTVESFAKAALQLSSKQSRSDALRRLVESPAEMAACLKEGLVLTGGDQPLLLLYR